MPVMFRRVTYPLLKVNSFFKLSGVAAKEELANVQNASNAVKKNFFNIISYRF